MSNEFGRLFLTGDCWCITAPLSIVAMVGSCYWLGWSSLFVGAGIVVVLRSALAASQMQYQPRKYKVGDVVYPRITKHM